VNNYQYVPNPITWVDLMGLSVKEPCSQKINKYESTPLLSKYLGEQAPNDPTRWNKMFGGNTICDYLDEGRRTPYEITVKDNRMVYANGDQAGKLIDTSQMLSIHMPGKPLASS
jgi:hypothetical protein